MIKSIEVTVTIVTDEHEDEGKATHQYALWRSGPFRDPAFEVGHMAGDCVMRMLPDIPMGDEEPHSETLGDA